MNTTKTDIKPDEIIAVFDNKEVTKDRYTISLTLEDDTNFLVTTNACCSIWSVSNDLLIPESVQEDDVHIGKEIQWDELPKELKNHIIHYFNLII